jgi:predicted kinase
MIKLTDILNEGVYDPGIFKAVFTAGGPGSGKSYAASTLFGMPERMPFVSAQGLKGVNSDSAFETYMEKAKMTTDLQKLTGSQFKKAMELRDKAKRVTVKRMNDFINGKLGMLIDGTGKNYPKIEKMVTALRKEGYDCYMVFVNTDLSVALQRNAERERVLPEKLVKDSWHAVQNNMGKFQSLFGSSNMLVVDNSEKKKFPDVVKKGANKFVKRPVKNHVAKDWIKKELELRKS